MGIFAGEPTRLQSRGEEHHSSLFGVLIVTQREWLRRKIAVLHPLVHINFDSFGQLVRRQDRFDATFLAPPACWCTEKCTSQSFGMYNIRMAAT